MLNTTLPKERGPYSNAVLAGNFLFISGQLPFLPNSNELAPDDIESQAEQVLNYIENILHAHALTLEDVVKVEVYLKDLQDAAKFNILYAERFAHEVKPARQMMQVAKLPFDVRVEISCIAYKKNHCMY